MAKQKTKEIPFSNTATEVDPGVWEFTTGGYKWQYVVGYGVNLRQWNDKLEVWSPVAYVRDHREAGCFAEGFSAGLLASKRYYEDEIERLKLEMNAMGERM